MLNKYILLFLATFLIITGCEKNQEAPVIPKVPNQPITLTTAALMAQPVETLLVETPNELLPVWRTYASGKPTLVLFSNDPFLRPVPDELREQALDLALNGTPEQIKKGAVEITSNPILLHSMTIDVALQSGMFAEVIWVIPFKKDQSLPPLADIQNKLRESGILSEDELNTLQQQGPNIFGTFRNTPYTISDINNLPIPQYPAWVHFDLSFFKPLYKNEVSTPLFTQVGSVLSKVRDANIQSYGASVSNSNLSGTISLDVRFLGDDIKKMISNPQSLDNGLTEIQGRRSQNLYLKEFFKKDEILNNLLAMEALAPDDASIQFDLYKALRETQQGNKALEALKKATILDPVYAIEYLELARVAMDKRRPDAALEMLDNIKAVFPDNPLIDMTYINYQISLGHQDKALDLIKELKSYPWSEAYDPGMLDRLVLMEKIARGED